MNKRRLLASLRTIGCFCLLLAATCASPSALRAADKPADGDASEKAAAEQKKDDEKQEAKKAAEKKAAEAKQAAEEAKHKAEEAKRIADAAKLAEERKKAEEVRLAREAQLKADAEIRAARDAALKAEADARAAAKVVSDRAESIAKTKISRAPEEVFRAVARLSAGADKDATDEDRYVLYIQAGEWEKFHDLIVAYPAPLAARLYGKMLNELMWGSPKPMFLTTDVLRLADAAPAELDDKQSVQIGKLLTHAVAKFESRAELVALLKQGTARLGGSDPARRRAAARALASAEFWKEAKEFGLNENEIPALVADTKAENPAKLAEETWNRLVGQLRDPAQTTEQRDEALTSLHQSMLQSTPQSVDSKLGPLLRDAEHPNLVWEIIELIGRKTVRAQDSPEFETRRVNLELQAAAMRILAAARPLDALPARAFANLYARAWLAEGQVSLTVHPTWKRSSADTRPKYPHVPIEDVLQSAPRAAWISVLDPQLASAVNLTIARLTLLSDNIDRLVPQLTEFSKRDKPIAAELASAYLSRWAQMHDPNFTPEALKQYKLDGHSIVLTRAEQEQSLKRLGAVLGSLDAETRKLLDDAQLVTAFDLCHSKAEPYTRDQVVQVFGPLENVPTNVLLTLSERMRRKLASNWRDLSVQRDAATKRDIGDVFQMVNDGYAEAEKITNEWLSAHADDWRINCTAGSLLSDWAEFAYFQAVAAGDDADRFATYLKRNSEALDRFRSGAKSYAAAVPKMKRSEFDVLPYKAWFYGLLGISQDSGINLRKGVTRPGMQEIKAAIQSLPGGAGGVHLGLFSAMVAENVKENRIAPEMKYRYLSNAVEITGREGTVYPAQEKVQYYESLLKEIRLRARLDGDEKIRQGGEFGVFVTLVHTAELARESGGFGRYLQNEIRRSVSGKIVVEQPFYRDRFEEALRSELRDFFEIKAIVFADPNAGARAMVPDKGEAEVAATNGPDSARRIRQETPLAYLHLIAKDATVDRVPPLEIELDFFDRDGKVVIPVPSNPLLIEIAADAPARRAAAEIAITEIVDARELPEHKRLKMDVVATAHGLVPDLEDLIDLQGYGLKTLNVDAREGLHVSELHSGDDGLYAKSERNWTVELDPAPLLRGVKDRVDFQFPKSKSDQIEVTFRTYKDMDPVAAAAQLTLVEGADAAAIAQPNYAAWTLGGLATLLLGGLAAFTALRKKPDDANAKPPAFVMPREATPFAVVTLLHRIRTSPEAKLTDPQRSELQREIVALERAAFANGTGPQSTRDMTSLADRWIRAALPTS